MAGQALAHTITVNMYNKKPKIDKNGDMIFKKSGMLLFAGIPLVIIFSAVAAFMDYYVPEIMKECSVDSSMTDTFYICGYTLIALFILIGARLIVMFFKCKIIVSKEKIVCKNIFLTKTIRLLDIEVITFSNRSGLVFRANNSKIAFGNFTIGLVELLKFIEENIPEYKCEKAIPKAKRMLRSNGVVC